MTYHKGPDILLTVPLSATEDIPLVITTPSFHKSHIEAQIRKLFDTDFTKTPHISYKALNPMLEIQGTVFNTKVIAAVIYLHNSLDKRNYTVYQHLRKGRTVIAVQLPEEPTEKIFTGKTVKSVRRRIRRFLRSEGFSIIDSHTIPANSNHLGADIITFS